MKKRILTAGICVFLSTPFSSYASEDFQIFLKQETVSSADLMTTKRLTVNAVNNTGEDMFSVSVTCEGHEIPLGDIENMRQVQGIGGFPLPTASGEGISANFCRVEYTDGGGEPKTMLVPSIPVP